MGAGLDPAAERGDLLVGQLFFGRHLEAILVPHRFQQQAFRRPVEADGGAGVAPLEREVSRVEPQAAVLLPVVVAPLAIFDQQRPDRGFEEVVPVGIVVGRKRSAEKEGNRGAGEPEERQCGGDPRHVGAGVEEGSRRRDRHMIVADRTGLCHPELETVVSQAPVSRKTHDPPWR
jgi:hypothetical protein